MEDVPVQQEETQEKPKKKVNYDKLYDKLFTPTQQQKKEMHGSYRFIPKFSSKQQGLSELEESVRFEVCKS